MEQKRAVGRNKKLIGLTLVIVFFFYLGTLYPKKDGEVVYSKKYKYGMDRLVFEKGMMVNGKKEGRWIKYNKEGFIISEGFYENGLMHGTFITYNSVDSTIYSVNQFRHDELDGISILFYANNMINNIGNYSAGKCIGKDIIYYKNGFVKQFVEYNNDTTSYIYFSPDKDTVKLKKYKGDSLIYEYDKR
jgi:antitoxin component YwqK of YwqJK toxin-antitoxin module